MKHNVLFYHGSGKVGNLIGYTQLGKQVFRAYQPVVSNPKTTSQENQRKKFNIMLDAARMFKWAYRVGLVDEGRSHKRTAFAQFMSVNFPFITGSTPQTYTLNWPQVICSQGSLPGVILDNDHIDQSTTPGEVSVGVQDRCLTYPGARADDELALVAVCPDTGDGNIGGFYKRSEMTELVTKVQSNWNDHDVHLYVFGIGRAGENYNVSSDSKYVGSFHAELE